MECFCTSRDRTRNQFFLSRDEILCSFYGRGKNDGVLPGDGGGLGQGGVFTAEGFLRPM